MGPWSSADPPAASFPTWSIVLQHPSLPAVSDPGAWNPLRHHWALAARGPWPTACPPIAPSPIRSIVLQHPSPLGAWNQLRHLWAPGWHIGFHPSEWPGRLSCSHPHMQQPRLLLEGRGLQGIAPRQQWPHVAWHQPAELNPWTGPYSDTLGPFGLRITPWWGNH